MQFGDSELFRKNCNTFCDWLDEHVVTECVVTGNSSCACCYEIRGIRRLKDV